MDRREALKKLAAGGAIAAGGSFVLSSNQVAFAASGPDPNTILDYEPTADGATFTIVGFPDNAFYQWRLNYLSLTPAGKKQVNLIDSTGNVLYSSPLGVKVCRQCTNWTSSSNSLGTISLERHNGMQPGDAFELDVIVTSSTTGTSEYRITGSYDSRPFVQQL
jgi:hypothetical protein